MENADTILVGDDSDATLNTIARMVALKYVMMDYRRKRMEIICIVAIA
jgi:hypothetical protein